MQNMAPLTNALLMCVCSTYNNNTPGAPKIMSLSLNLQGEEVVMPKWLQLGFPQEYITVCASVLLMHVCSTYSNNTPGAPKIISPPLSLRSEEVVKAKKKT